MALYPDEQRFNCAEWQHLDAPGSSTFTVWNVLDFGGKANPLVYSRFGSLAARTAQALRQLGAVRLPLRVDVLAMLAPGKREQRQEYVGLILLWCLFCSGSP